MLGKERANREQPLHRLFLLSGTVLTTFSWPDAAGLLSCPLLSEMSFSGLSWALPLLSQGLSSHITALTAAQITVCLFASPARLSPARQSLELSYFLLWSLLPPTTCLSHRQHQHQQPLSQGLLPA